MGIKSIWDDGSVTTSNVVASLANGTSGRGEVDCPYARLLSVFGEPENGDGYKIQAEWTIATPAGIATIYDWKQGDCYHGEGNGTPVEQVTQWSIGGHNRQVNEWINKAIQK